MSVASDPAIGAIAVTPNDSTDLSSITGARALYIGGFGNIKVLTSKDETVTFSNVASGTVLPIRVKRVYSTDTTATNIILLY